MQKCRKVGRKKKQNHHLKWSDLLDFKLSQYWSRNQPELFPQFESTPDPLTEKHCKIITILDVLNIERFVCLHFLSAHTGRPPSDRVALACAFIAKAVLNLPTTVALIDRLRCDSVLRRICGFESKRRIPSEGTFSNTFAEFAAIEFFSRVHEGLIREKYSDQLVCNVSRDSTAIAGREKPLKKASAVKELQKPKKRGRPKKGEEPPPSEPTRIERQGSMTLDEMLLDLPIECDCGAKKNAKGFAETWIGYKLHLDVADGGVPISAILTSASVHDSQVAIPLESMTMERVVSLYSLMDSAYDAKGIKSFIEANGKVPVIDPNRRRGGDAAPLDPAKRERYKDRTTVERSNSRIKDDFNAHNVRVKGGVKVMAHLMCGVVALAAEQLIRCFT